MLKGKNSHLWEIKIINPWLCIKNMDSFLYLRENKINKIK